MVKYFVFIFALILFSFSYVYGDEIKYTSFDIILTPNDFDLEGPNHQILILNTNESASIPITIKNNDSIQHEISLTIPEMQNPSYFAKEYFFDPQLIIVPPNSEKQVKLNLTIKNDTDAPWGQINILAKSKSFGMTAKHFYVAIGDKDIEIDPFIDHSMRSGMPGAAFPNLYNGYDSEYSELYYLDDNTPNNIGIPRYLPDGYSFQGISDLDTKYPLLVFAKTPITNTTESMDFIEKGGIMVYYGVDGVNVNRTDWISDYVGQEESKQIMINGLMGTASGQQERTVAYDEGKYMFPAEISLSDGHYSYVGLRGNIVLEELVKMAASLPLTGKTESPIVISKVELYGPSSFFTKNIQTCFDDSDTLGPWAVGWIEIQNQSNHTVTTQNGSPITIGNMQTGGPLKLESGQKCIIQTEDVITTRIGPGGSQGNGPPHGYLGSSSNINYFIEGNLFVNQTPEFSDTYGDTRIWQLVGDKWEFGPTPLIDLSDVKNLPKQELPRISPLKQFKSGLASADVSCKGNLTVVIKTSTGSPACVKPEHVKRLLANGWFFVPPSDRAIRPLVTVIDNEENLGIELTEMEIISKQNYGTLHENNLKVTTFQGNLSGIPTVVSKITNVSNQKIMLNQVLITGSIILSADSAMTPMYADVIGCSISHQEDGNVTCPYPTAVYEPIELEPDEYFVSYFSDDFAHKLGPINKITTSVWYDLESVDSPHHRTEIDSLLELEK